MQMLYNSDSYVVVRFDLDASAGEGAPLAVPRGGFEIVDKLARKEIYIEGALADRFQRGVQSLVDSGPTEEQFDEFIAGFTGSALQPVVVH
jgi:hypothetical protein